jgi:hypothetical protein
MRLRSSIITTERRVLPPNLVQFNRFHAGMTFDGKQRIRSLNRAVLPGVAGENHRPCRSWINRTSSNICRPPICPASSTTMTALSAKFTLDEKIGDRRWRRKPGLLHFHDLLTLRRENDHAPARLPKLLHQFAQNKTFARARTAAKDRNLFVERSKDSRAWRCSLSSCGFAGGDSPPAGDNHRRPLSRSERFPIRAAKLHAGSLHLDALRPGYSHAAG